ncbi:hypothetical protein U1Q18_023039 [Sarracenia purpurea var. burkii]
MQLGRSLSVLGLMSPVGQRVCLLVFKQWGFMSVGMLGGTCVGLGLALAASWASWVACSDDGGTKQREDRYSQELLLWEPAEGLVSVATSQAWLSRTFVAIFDGGYERMVALFCSGDWVLWSVSCWFFSGFVASPEGRVMPFLVAVCGVVWVVGLLDVGCGCVVVMLLLAAWCELLGEGGVGGVWLCGLFSLFAGRTFLLLLWRLAQCCLLRDGSQFPKYACCRGGLPYGFCCCSGVFLIDEALEAQLVWNPPSYEVVEACVGGMQVADSTLKTGTNSCCYGMRGVGIPQSLVYSISLWRFPLFLSIPLLAILCGIKRETGKSDGQLWVGDYELGLQKNITAAA